MGNQVTDLPVIQHYHIRSFFTQRRISHDTDGRAQYELASQPDYPSAMHWMQQAAEQSDPLAADKEIRASAAWQVGDWYQAGRGEPKNPLLALATQTPAIGWV